MDIAHINRYRRSMQIIAALLILLGLLLGLAPVMHAEQVALNSTAGTDEQSTAVTYTTYLPLIANGDKPSTEPEPEPEPVPGGPSGALLLGDQSYRSAGMAVDTQGGMHMVFLRVAPFATTGEPAPVYYAYCAPAQGAACADRSAWRVTALEPQHFTHAQIQLTPAGKPRLMLIGLTSDSSGGFSSGHLYRYGECDTQCGAATNWRFTTVLISNSSGSLIGETDYTYRNFALDHLGRPRFVYEDRASRTAEDRQGAWYVFCNADCGSHSAEAPTWLQTRIDNPASQSYITERAVLVFSADGKPRVFAQDGGTFEDSESKLIYLECNSDCEDGANWWRSVPIIGTGHGSGVYGWSAAINAQGHPRMVFYPRGGPFIYAWCNDECTTATNWEGAQLDFGADSGMHASLALDAQDRPRIAYHAGPANLGYAWCDTGCESGEATWNAGQIEDGNTILNDLDVTILPTCVRGGWFSGLRIDLALDPHGNPRIAYDAEFKMECKRYPEDPNSTLTFVETKWWTSRVMFFSQP